MPNKTETYAEIISAAVQDIVTNGYDSPERVAYWMKRIREAADQVLTSTHTMDQRLRDNLALIYKRLVERGQIATFHQGVGRFTIEKLRPQLRAELDRRIVASANLIRLNKEQVVDRTLRRFSGWATSVPKGGAPWTAEKRSTVQDIRKPLAQIKFEERRVLVDQGHKLFSAISDIVATDGGAIAARWHSNWRQPHYDYRPDHKALDQKVYAIRGSWAISQGLITKGDGYTDDIVRPAEEPFCRCRYVYLYNLRDIPKDMLTKKGEQALAEARAKIAAMVA